MPTMTCAAVAVQQTVDRTPRAAFNRPFRRRRPARDTADSGAGGRVEGDRRVGGGAGAGAWGGAGHRGPGGPRGEAGGWRGGGGGRRGRWGRRCRGRVRRCAGGSV